MSHFTSNTMACPACSAAVAFELVHSVNADRMPSLRKSIVDETFQRLTCPKCGSAFRVEPDFNFVEHGRKLWIAALPVSRLAQWQEEERAAAAVFEWVYGERGSPFMQRLGHSLTKRVTFGWAALREKLIAVDVGLDDTTLELCKCAVVRNSESAPIGFGTELRLVGADDAHLWMAWLRSVDESLGEAIKVKRGLYDEIAADEGDAWAPLRSRLDGLFVDMNRLLVVPAAAAA